MHVIVFILDLDIINSSEDDEPDPAIVRSISSSEEKEMINRSLPKRTQFNDLEYDCLRYI